MKWINYIVFLSGLLLLTNCSKDESILTSSIRIPTDFRDTVAGTYNYTGDWYQYTMGTSSSGTTSGVLDVIKIGSNDSIKVNGVLFVLNSDYTFGYAGGMNEDYGHFSLGDTVRLFRHTSWYSPGGNGYTNTHGIKN